MNGLNLLKPLVFKGFLSILHRIVTDQVLTQAADSRDLTWAAKAKIQPEIQIHRSI